ncbi:ABC transporter permease [Insolitispirillum peregrinum]|uniref:Putative hydroxymethylpyrimidine transport system permease protein n=1 Tax=Insolitispirillum peregrinum TaxID=80876 RepID=A0A1N7NH20_9PROT|nr:ABC transporter permease [Insolitispirillum peregrinum]SIS97634.1 putative hydroxymethylpyrimidine transport system permease protein [Insolitispirillum peregrinum]
MIRRLIHILVSMVMTALLWQIAYLAAGQQDYLLPSPLKTLTTAVLKADLLARHALTTGAEILLGLLGGGLVGVASALLLASFAPLRRWLVPVLVISQAIPVFAIAPLLVLWLGYGMASKVAMASLIIYFPITTAFLDGLSRTAPGWLDLAQVMGGSRWTVLRHIRIPAALPSLGAGLKVAVGVAPIGAVIGEWVGSSTGLGYLMLHANARMQVDLMFAALLVLAGLAITLFWVTDRLLARLLPWRATTNE